LQKMKEAEAALKNAGYDLDAKGFHHPDGTVTPLSAFSSPAALQAAGFDDSVLKELEKVNAAVMAEYGNINGATVTSLAVDGGGGSGNSAAASSAIDDSSYQSDSPFAMGPDQRKARMAGKTVNLDGEPIGVAGNNIVEMVHAAYQKKRSG